MSIHSYLTFDGRIMIQHLFGEVIQKENASIEVSAQKFKCSVHCPIERRKCAPGLSTFLYL